MLILLFLVAGKLTAILLSLPVPGSIIGLLLLFVALSTGLLPQRYLQPAASQLLNNITLLFVPAGVGLMQYGDVLKQQGLVLLVVSIASLVLTLLGVGWCYQRLNR